MNQNELMRFARYRAAVFDMDGLLLEEALGAGGFAVKAGVIALLQSLQARGVPCVVASSTHRDEIECRLAQAGLAGFFSAFSGGDEVQRAWRCSRRCTTRRCTSPTGSANPRPSR